MPGKTIQAPQKQVKTVIMKDNLIRQSLLSRLAKNYQNLADDLTKLLDIFMIFCMVTGMTQFIYFSLNGSYQYNAFLGGFCSSVGSFVLAGTIKCVC
jgi:oligosaccharyltransferase complex subunit epsilon